MTYQAPTTGLHSPTLLPFLQNPTDYPMLAQPLKFGVNCCSSGLSHPAACTQARVPLTFGHAHRSPLYPICSKRVANWALAEDSDDVFKISQKWPRKNWKPQTKTSPPPPPPLPIQPIYIPIDSSRRQDSEHINFNRFDSCHPKVMLLTPSCSQAGFSNKGSFSVFSLSISCAVCRPVKGPSWTSTWRSKVLTGSQRN